MAESASSEPCRQMGQKRHKLAMMLTFALFFCQSGIPQPSIADRSSFIATGFTAPNRSTLLAPADPGRIQSVNVNEGDFVRAGDLVARLDDDAQKARLVLSQLRAASELTIELASVKQRRFDDDRVRIEQLRARDKASEAEFTAALAESDAARVQVRLAEYEHQLDQADLELQSCLLDRLSIKAPFSGFIAECLHEVGESVESKDGIVRLVELDPLIVTVDFPLGAAAFLSTGQDLEIQPVDTAFSARRGTVDFVNRVADPASQTVRVKLRVKNDDRGWIAGMRVNVLLSKSAAPKQPDQKSARAQSNSNFASRETP